MHKVMLYALSTCIWCKRTRQFLDENHVPYDYVYVDVLDREAKKQMLAEIRRWNKHESFPTIVIDGEKVLVGFEEERLREALGL
jgi:glutaredoxin